MSRNTSLRHCAAQMIISGNWNNYTDKAIKAAYRWHDFPVYMIDHDAIAATKRYRDSGELQTEIYRQLEALPDVEGV